jgi:DNA polymerase-3 subunit epsilon
MISIWCDTETTGVDPKISGAFEIAFLVYAGVEKLDEKLYRLNPLNDEVLFSGEAFQINGVPEDAIRSYPPMGTVIPEIVKMLKKYAPPEKLVFAGYNCPFDYGHLGGLLYRCGYDIGDYFTGRFIDVLELVKRAKEQRLLGATKNNKLETMAKSLGIVHNDAHTALSDIKATRQLYEAIFLMTRSNKK